MQEKGVVMSQLIMLYVCSFGGYFFSVRRKKMSSVCMQILLSFELNENHRAKTELLEITLPTVEVQSIRIC